MSVSLVLVIATREFKSLFLSPLAWTILAVLQGILGYLFLNQVETFTLIQTKLAGMEGAPGLTDIVVTPLFSNAGIILLLVTPLLTMRLICEERRNKTLSLLLSAPISDSNIIIGKYLGTLGFLLLIVALIAFMPLSLLMGGELDNGKLLANILALCLLVAGFSAVGLFMSTIAGHPTVAAIGSIGILLLLWILDWTNSIKDQRSELFEYLSILRHFQTIQSGQINTMDLCYFVLFIATFLLLSIRCLANERFQK